MNLSDPLEFLLQNYFVSHFKSIILDVSLKVLVRDFEKVEMVKTYSIDSGEVSWIELTLEVKKRLKF